MRSKIGEDEEEIDETEHTQLFSEEYEVIISNFSK